MRGSNLLLVVMLMMVTITGLGCAAQVTLTGTVTSAATGEPLHKVEVCALQLEGASGLLLQPSATARTDSQGHFTLKLDVAEPAPGSVAVWTRSLLYANELSTGTRLAANIGPTLNEARQAAIDLANPPSELTFALETRFGEEHIVMLPMADGTKLATDYITPKGEGPFPSILQRTPYGRSLEDGLSTGLLEQGYAIICQDHRGRFDSEGIGLAFKACGWGEHQDGYDTVEWIAAQPWSNGKVGTFGASAGGITQNLMAGAAPPHLTCQVVLVASANFYEDTAYPGGAFRKQMVEGWLAGNNFPPRRCRRCWIILTKTSIGTPTTSRSAPPRSPCQACNLEAGSIASKAGQSAASSADRRRVEKAPGATSSS